MANNLFVTYDLIKTKDYEAVYKAIKSLGDWAKVTESNWYVDSTYTAEQAANIVRAAMDHDDKLVVVDAENNSFYCYNITSDVLEYMQSHWHI
ncbi:hypothetical protein [Hafnia paralvei]|uniref:CRISPR-associated protein Cas2 n=1 Tax=Salmonella enterica I TaxID=59201 RepID=A0A5Y3M6X5_SALET|nr:hypothetical protein [Hafnia paralvei]ECI2867537.1 hypothetical protein [Salmonella enterica subsp. enterica]UBM39177.1 hypothetical protein K9N75_12350 [Hafnia paralvei]